MAEPATKALRSVALTQLAQIVGGRIVLPEALDNHVVDHLVGKAVEQIDDQMDVQITGLASLADARPGELSHLSSSSYASALPATSATAVLLREVDLPGCKTIAVVVANPYWAYARLSQEFEVPQRLSGGGTAKIAEAATVDASAQLADGVRVADGARIGAGTTIGAGCVIHANAVIGAGAVLGAQVQVHPGAVLADGVRLGDGCTIHPNAVIGGEGFGYAPDANGVLERIAQLGSVVLGENVNVGAGSTIDRGALGDTIIGDGVKIDNQVQIGHNCVIGNHSVICGCCGIVGSTTIGAHCVLGGGVGIGGDGPISLCAGVTVSGMTHVSRSIEVPGVYSGGVLHSESRRWKRNALRFADLDGLAKRVASLEKRFRGGS